MPDPEYTPGTPEWISRRQAAFQAWWAQYGGGEGGGGEGGSVAPWQAGHTFAISGVVAASDRFPGLIVPVAAGTVVKLARIFYRIRSGTSVTFSVKRNGTDVTGLTALAAGTTQGTTNPTDVTLSDGDYLEVVPSAVSGSPTDFSATLVLETSA